MILVADGKQARFDYPEVYQGGAAEDNDWRTLEDASYSERDLSTYSRQVIEYITSTVI